MPRSRLTTRLGRKSRTKEGWPLPKKDSLYIELLCIIVLCIGHHLIGTEIGGAMDIGKDLVAASATPLVLAILAEGDSYGYAIIKRVGTLSGGRLQWTDGMANSVICSRVVRVA